MKSLNALLLILAVALPTGAAGVIGDTLFRMNG